MKNALIFLGLLFIVLGSCKKTENEQEAIDAYLAESEFSYTMIQEGLYYVQHVKGKGESPTVDATVRVDYTGSYIDGTEFDSRFGDYPINEWVEGLRIGIPMMKYGGKSTFIMHSDLGYGRSGRASIPGNTPLVFEFELFDFSLN